MTRPEKTKLCRKDENNVEGEVSFPQSIKLHKQTTEERSESALALQTYRFDGALVAAHFGLPHRRASGWHVLHENVLVALGRGVLVSTKCARHRSS